MAAEVRIAAERAFSRRALHGLDNHRRNGSVRTSDSDIDQRTPFSAQRSATGVEFPENVGRYSGQVCRDHDSFQTVEPVPVRGLEVQVFTTRRLITSPGHAAKRPSSSVTATIPAP